MASNVIILSGYGLNCEEESLRAFELAGSVGTIMHVNDLIGNPSILQKFDCLMIPGGFSYGDDTGSGNAFALKLRNHLMDDIITFYERSDTKILGICNGCQILVRLGLVGDTINSLGKQSIALTHNDSNRYQCRWVNIKPSSKISLWTKNVTSMHVPIAHGEGKFVIPSATLELMQQNDQIAFQYVDESNALAGGVFPTNPNGSVEDIAGVTDHTGKVLALMPHPERAINEWQLPDSVDEATTNALELFRI